MYFLLMIFDNCPYGLIGNYLMNRRPLKSQKSASGEGVVLLTFPQHPSRSQGNIRAPAFLVLKLQSREMIKG